MRFPKALKFILLNISVTLIPVLLLVLWYSYTPFWRVTDPHDSRFVTEDFRYEDFRSPEKIQEALRVMFPKGTPKERLDSVLYKNLLHMPVPSGADGHHTGAWTEKIERLPSRKDKLWGTNVWGYFYEFPLLNRNAIAIYAYYDPQDRLIQLEYSGIPLLN